MVGKKFSVADLNVAAVLSMTRGGKIDISYAPMWSPGSTMPIASCAQPKGQGIGSTQMVEMQVNVKTADGIADCDLVYPDQNGKWPAVVLYSDIGGRRPVVRDMAKRLAAEGFVVLVPNPFYRVGPTPVYEDFKFGDEKTTARMGEVRKFVTAAGSESDAHAFVAFLQSQKQVGGKLGAVGYCMGGGMAMRTAAAEPAKVAAAASFHGSQLASDAPIPASVGAQDQGAALFRLCY